MRLIKILITLATFGLFSQISMGKTMTVTGNLPRDTSLDYFDLEIKVTDIQKTTPAVGEDLFKDRIRVWLADLSTSPTDYVPFEGDLPVIKIPFTIRQTASLVQTPNASNLTDFTYSVRISANSVGGLKDTLLAGNKTSTLIQVYYYEEKKPNVEAKVENKSIAINTAIVKAAPTSVVASGTHRSVKVRWAPATSTTWSDGSTQAPSKVVAVAIDKTTAATSIPAYLYDSTAATDAEAAEGACVYVPDSDTCVQCSDTDKHYLNPTKLAQLSAQGIFTGTASATTGELGITGLENGKSYSVFTFFTPGGTTRSSCQTVVPTANTTWAEHNGEEDATLSDPKCFIATAAYGTALHKNLRPLRWFRDHALRQTSLGSALVDWYYEKGPAAASVVAAYPALGFLVRMLLWLPVILISAWMTLTGEASFPIQTLIVATSTLILMLVLLKRRLHGGTT